MYSGTHFGLAVHTGFTTGEFTKNHFTNADVISEKGKPTDFSDM